MIVEDLILFCLVLFAMFLLYFLMGHVDRFLDENLEFISEEEDKKMPTAIVLSKDMSEEEIIKEVLYFKKTHKDSYIILSEENDED